MDFMFFFCLILIPVTDTFDRDSPQRCTWHWRWTSLASWRERTETMMGGQVILWAEITVSAGAAGWGCAYSGWQVSLQHGELNVGLQRDAPSLRILVHQGLEAQERAQRVHGEYKQTSRRAPLMIVMKRSPQKTCRDSQLWGWTPEVYSSVTKTRLSSSWII